MEESNGSPPDEALLDSLFKFADPTGKGEIDFAAYEKIMTMSDEEQAQTVKKEEVSEEALKTIFDKLGTPPHLICGRGRNFARCAIAHRA